jgi:superfamily II DNA or RNA helicase
MLASTNASDFEAVRNHTTELIEKAADGDEPVLIESPPGSGKTTSAYELAHEADKPITYLASRIDLYEQAEHWCEEPEQKDITYERIPAPQRDCPR